MKQAAKLLAFMLTAFIVLGSARADFIKAGVAEKTGNEEEAVCYKIDYETYDIDASQAGYADIFFVTDTGYADGCIGYKKDGEWVAELYELTNGQNHVRSSSIQGSEYLQVQIWNVDAHDAGEGTVSIEQIMIYDVNGKLLASIGDNQIDLSSSATETLTIAEPEADTQYAKNAKDSKNSEKKSRDTAKTAEDTVKAVGDTAKAAGNSAKSAEDTAKTSEDSAQEQSNDGSMLPQTGELDSWIFYLIGCSLMLIGTRVIRHRNMTYRK